MDQIQNQPQPLGADVEESRPNLEPLRMGMNKFIIWRGLVEWQINQKNKKISALSLCLVVSNELNNVPDVPGVGWPRKLMISFYPKPIVAKMCVSQFLNVSKVEFKFEPCAHVHSLADYFENGYAGVVHFTGQDLDTTKCSIQNMIILHSPCYRGYFGFIPNSQRQEEFQNQISTVTMEFKTLQANESSGPEAESASKIFYEGVDEANKKNKEEAATVNSVASWCRQRRLMLKKRAENPNEPQGAERILEADLREMRRLRRLEAASDALRLLEF